MVVKCGECGQKLKSWSEKHTSQDCEAYKRKTMKPKLFRIAYSPTFGFGNTVFSELKKFRTLEDAMKYASEYVKGWKNLSVYGVHEVGLGESFVLSKPLMP